MTEGPASGKLAPEKLAVVLLNLGGPTEPSALQPFLFSLFRDKNVICLPNPFRILLAGWLAVTRSRGSGKKAYAPLGGRSPLLENTQAQAQALEKELQKNNPGARVFVAMRHWHPKADAVVKEVASFQPDKIVLLPLYPQYSTTSTYSAIQDWRRAASKAGLQIPQEAVCCYPVNPGFIAASAALIQEKLKWAPTRVRVLFSAHSMPEKIIRDGDPYQQQIEQTAAAIVKQLNIPLLDWQICYQSRIGRQKWIDPSIEQALQKAADDKVSVVVYPIAFVSEHVETLVELDIKYRQRALAMGIKEFLRVPTVSLHPKFIEGLRGLVTGEGRDRSCPQNFTKCCREEKK